MLIVSWSIIPPPSSLVLPFGFLIFAISGLSNFFFFFSLSNCGSFALPQEKNKAAKSSSSFFETDFPHGGPCYLHTGYRNRRLQQLLGSSKGCTCVWL